MSGMPGWIHALADVHTAASERVRAAIKKLTDAEDSGTADLITDILRTPDLQLRLLSAHTNRQQPTTQIHSCSIHLL